MLTQPATRTDHLLHRGGHSGGGEPQHHTNVSREGPPQYREDHQHDDQHWDRAAVRR